MDLATLLGLVGALGIVLTAMLMGGSVGMYFDVPSVLIVFVGSIFVVLIKFSLGQFLGAIRVALKAFSFEQVKPQELIDEVVQIADAARKAACCRWKAANSRASFSARACSCWSTATTSRWCARCCRRNCDRPSSATNGARRSSKRSATSSPAMGMIGTLVGLVAMLGNMDDPKKIGPAMGVALLTTLYGAVLANMIALPIADKLALRRVEEGRVKSMIIDALLAIQAGQNPRVVRSMLMAYLPDSKRDNGA